MTRNPEKARLRNFCTLCGARAIPIERRNPFPLVEEPNACICNSCRRRMGAKTIRSYAAERAVELEVERTRVLRFLWPRPKLTKEERAMLDATPTTSIEES